MKKKTKAKSGKKVVSKSAAKKKAPPTPVQEALQITWLLKGKLKSARIAYLKIGELLVRVRDRNLYAELHHPDLEDYAEKRLQLGRTSLYKYLQVHDWVLKFHPAWAQPKPEGFIPELNDTADLMWIEEELARKDLAPAKRATLETLQKKALEGKLRAGEIDPLRRKEQNTPKDGLRTFLSTLRILRTRGSKLANMPSEVLSQLDVAIDILKNDHVLQLAGVRRLETGGLDAERTQIS